MSPALVLLPGMDGTGDLFAPLLAELGSDTRTVVVRYPAGEFLSYDRLTTLVKTHVPDSEPFVLLAESFSGPIAISLAASQPRILRGLILCASFARNPRPLLLPVLCRTAFISSSYLPGWAMRAAMLNETSPSRLSGQLHEAVSKVNPEVLQARLKAVLAVDVVQDLDRIVVPSLYLRALQDRLIPSGAGDLIIKNRKNWRLAEIAGPHLLLQSAPREAARAIDGFIQELSDD